MTSNTPARPKQMTMAFAFAALVLLPMSSAIADEAFVCGDGSVVNVKSGDLEIVKRTSPCVARYFGLDVSTNDANTANAIALRATALLRGHASASLPLPSRNPQRSEVAQNAAPADAVETAKTTPVSRATSSIETGSTSRGAASVEEPATDYRNVRIINSPPGAAAWFRHNR